MRDQNRDKFLLLSLNQVAVNRAATHATFYRYDVLSTQEVSPSQLRQELYGFHFEGFFVTITVGTGDG